MPFQPMTPPGSAPFMDRFAQKFGNNQFGQAPRPQMSPGLGQAQRPQMPPMALGQGPQMPPMQSPMAVQPGMPSGPVGQAPIPPPMRPTDPNLSLSGVQPEEWRQKIARALMMYGRGGMPQMPGGGGPAGGFSQGLNSGLGQGSAAMDLRNQFKR